MKIIIVANKQQEEEIRSKHTSPENEMVFVQENSLYATGSDYDVIFYLKEKTLKIDPEKIDGKPVFINSVIETLEQNKLPHNFHRINAWPGFLKRTTWEIASANAAEASGIFEQLGWNMISVKDEIGLVSGRVISMIINEAFFAFDEGISTIEEIDNAMKLGTNYPYGPFEWLEKIGLQNIYGILYALSQRDKRYSIAPLLQKQYLEFTHAK